MREQGYTLKLTDWRLGYLFGCLVLLWSLIILAFPTKVLGLVLGYPHAKVPCQHFPYNVTGYCANYDWGPVRTEAFDHPSQISSRGYTYRNCTDYVAWKLSTLGIRIPYNLGHAGKWYGNVPAYQRSSTPKVGGVVTATGTLGHVAFIESVNKLDTGNPLNSDITVSEYNFYGLGAGSIRSGKVSALGFSGFINFGVGNAPISSTRANLAGVVIGKSDFNRDGVSDFVIFSEGLWSVKSGAGSNQYIIKNLAFGRSTDTPLLGDYNRDGMADFAIYSGGQWAVRSGSSPHSYISQGVRLGDANDIPLTGDFNNDNVPDFVTYSGGEWNVRSGISPNNYIVQDSIFGSANDRPLVADFNNDDIDDMVINSNGIWAVRSGVKPYAYIAQGLRLGDAGCKAFTKDYNRDGVADFIVSCNGQWAVKSGQSPYPFLSQGAMLGKSGDVSLVGQFSTDKILDFAIASNGQWAVKSGVYPNSYVRQGVSLGDNAAIPMGR